MKENIRTWFCLLLAAVVLLCIFFSLKDYEMPVYAIDETIQDTEETESNNDLKLPGGEYEDGVYFISADCYDQESEAEGKELNFDYTISMNVEIQDNRITAITDVAGSPSQYNPEYDPKNDTYIEIARYGMGNMQGVEEQIINLQTYEVDAVSGATYSSWAMMECIWWAMEEARIQ